MEPNRVLDLNLTPWHGNKVMLSCAAIMLEQVGRDCTIRGYHLELCRLLVFMGGACAIASTGVTPTDRAVLLNLGDVPEAELADAAQLLSCAGEVVEELATQDGVVLLALLAAPFNAEVGRRYDAAVRQ